MGSWDCYCAICASTMRPVEVREHAPPNQQQDSTQSSQSMGNGGSQDDPDDEYGYDPTVLRPQDIEWVLNCRCIGLNPWTKRVFTTEQGHYDDYGGMSCNAEDDPDCPQLADEMLLCYREDADMGLLVFPFHWDCATILWRRLVGAKDPCHVNMNLVYEAMHASYEDYGSRLELTYTLDGNDRELTCEQFWDSILGEEYYVSSPLQTSETASLLKADLQRPFTLPAIDQTLRTKVRSDPFANLPQEITNQILSYLDHTSLMQLFQASWIIHSNSHENNSLWKVCAITQLPWFFELHYFLQSKDAACIESMKGLYLWARKTTVPRKHLRLPYTVIANRRRIWAVCDQLAEHYDAALAGLEEE